MAVIAEYYANLTRSIKTDTMADGRRWQRIGHGRTVLERSLHTDLLVMCQTFQVKGEKQTAAAIKGHPSLWSDTTSFQLVLIA